MSGPPQPGEGEFGAVEPHESDLGAEERELAARLVEARPIPGAGFRGRLGRYLAAGDPGHGPRPPRLRATAAACLGVALLLLGLGALTAAGVL